MIHTEPRVHLIAGTSFYDNPASNYLANVGGGEWLNRILADGMMSDAERIVEFAGRACYRSWAPGLNANVTKVRDDSAAYLGNILKSGHGSVLEHASFTFVFENVSRVFTHELVRHRAGVAISQESLRYVRLTELGFRIPEILLESPPHRQTDDNWNLTFAENALSTVIALVETLEHFQLDAAEKYGLDDDGVPFHYKKEVTSALRRLAPIGLSTTLVWTANLRTIRHCLEMRTAAGAEEEIRTVFQEVGRLMQVECPYLFADYTIDEEGSWTTQSRKV